MHVNKGSCCLKFKKYNCARNVFMWCMCVYRCMCALTYSYLYICIDYMYLHRNRNRREREKRKNDPDFIHKHYWHVIKCSNDPNNKIKCVGESNMLSPTQWRRLFRHMQREEQYYLDVILPLSMSAKTSCLILSPERPKLVSIMNSRSPWAVEILQFMYALCHMHAWPSLLYLISPVYSAQFLHPKDPCINVK